MRYTIPFSDIPTGAVANTLSTMVTAIAADTLGYRFWVSKITVGGSLDAPVDLPIEIALKRVNDVSAGGVGTANAAVTPIPQDSLSRASILTAGEDYETGGVEPTTYGIALYQNEINGHNTLTEEWDFDNTPVICGRDMLVGLLCGPRTAALVRVTGELVVVEF
jgi:hypothetical protein